MNRTLLAALVTIALGASILPSAASTPPASHSAHATGEHGLSLDHGRKWATDAPLRQGMAEIRATVATLQPPTKKGAVSKAEYQQAGIAIEKSVGDIVARCKLPPEADANLHVVVAALVNAADTLQGKTAAQPAQGLGGVRHALAQYQRFFEDRPR